MALPIASQDQVASGQSTPGLPTPQAQIASQEPVKINDKGFTVLSEGINPKYDIIMIHGFQGHPERTWLHKSPKPNFLKRLFGKRGPRESCYWPGELLPQDFKDCRVVVYGYDSDVVNFFSTASQATIFDHGRNLLGELEALRRKDANRPIIFIAHSLGGLILKEALRRSRDHGLPNASAPYLKTIYSATSAVVFMGTPHRGSDYADWGVIAQRIAAVAGFDATGRIIQDLRVDGAVLNKIDDDFIPLRGRFAIYTFQEARGVKGVQGLNDRVVLDVSSKLGSENEVSASIDANHMEMCRFSGFEDHGYRKLRDTIRGHIDRAELPTFDDVEKYMQSLKLEIGLARLNEVEPAHAKTFQWLFDHGNTGYDQWLQNDEPLFWVKGKAGSGKSTLMHFAYHDDRTKMALESYPYSSQGKVSSPAFFLHNRGSPLQKSLEGLLRTIIHRILTDAKELQGPVLSHASKFIKSEVSGWNMSALDAAVEAICKQALVPLRICLFVDALDEYSGNHEDIVKFLRGLIKRFPGAKTKLKICFSSRPLQIFLDRFGDESDEGYQVRGFDIRDHTKDDIKEYLSAQFQLNLRMRRLIASGDQQVQRDIKLLRNMILYKAEGVFLWVRLVSEQLLGILTDGDYRGNSIANLKDRLTELPNELDEFYQCIVDGVNLKYQNELSRIAQILLCTKRPPMSLQDFLAAFRCSLVPSDSTLEACLKEIKDAPDCESAERFVRSRSGGLIEIIRGFTGSSLVKQFGLDTFGCRVQFIHQSVKTFFQKDRGDNDHTLQSPPHFNGHLCLQRFIITCMANISEHTLRNMDSSTDTQNWVGQLLYSCHRAEESTGRVYSSLLYQLSGRRYECLRGLLMRTSLAAIGQFTNVDEFAVVAGLEKYVHELIRSRDLDQATSIRLATSALEISIRGYSRSHILDMSPYIAHETVYRRITKLLITNDGRRSNITANDSIPLWQVLVRYGYLDDPLIKEQFNLLMTYCPALNSLIWYQGHRCRDGNRWYGPRNMKFVLLTVLHYAILSCSEDCVNTLLELKPRVNVPDSGKIVPLGVAFLLIKAYYVDLSLPCHFRRLKCIIEVQAMSRIAIKLMDAGHMLISKRDPDGRSYALTQEHLNMLRQCRASTDDRFLEPPIGDAMLIRDTTFTWERGPTLDMTSESGPHGIII